MLNPTTRILAVLAFIVAMASVVQAQSFTPDETAKRYPSCGGTPP